MEASLANQLNADYAERGVQIVHIIIEDGTGDGVVDEQDAALWHHGIDFDGDGTIDVLDVPVLADTDRGLWNHYIQDCSELGIFCQFSCHVTPQHQIMDRGLITVDDKCSVPDGETTCEQCGYDDADVRATFDALLPPQWCGSAQP